MLFEHFAAVEAALLATARIPANSGHSLHKGTPREAFISEFLYSHLPSNLAIGTGEIVDHESEPGEQRRQFDIVLYKRDLPKLDFGGGISGFLAESVIATVEVKSTLDKAGMRQAMTAAAECKKLKKCVMNSFSSGFIPPAPINYVVAYDGPEKIETVLGWITTLESELGISQEPLPLGEQRIMTPSSSIDGAFILGKGFVQFDNFPVGFVNDSNRAAHPGKRWAAANLNPGTLMLLFQQLTQASQNLSASFLDPVPYARKLRVHSMVMA